MKHKIVQGEVEIVKMINPCFYWIRCSDCGFIAQIHQKLETEIQPVTAIEIGNKVVARYFDGNLYRGVVLSLATRPDLSLVQYHIFLVDALKTVVVAEEDIFSVPDDETSEFEPPHVVGLHGVQPIEYFESPFMMSEDAYASFVHQSMVGVLKRCVSFAFQKSTYASEFEEIDLGIITITDERNVQIKLHGLLAQAKLIKFSTNFLEAWEASGILENVSADMGLVHQLMYPSEEVSDDVNENGSSVLKSLVIPPPPRVHYDAERWDQLRKIPRAVSALIRPWEDAMIPIIHVESFEEYNARVRAALSNKCFSYACDNSTSEDIFGNDDTNSGSYGNPFGTNSSSSTPTVSHSSNSNDESDIIFEDPLRMNKSCQSSDISLNLSSPEISRVVHSLPVTLPEPAFGCPSPGNGEVSMASKVGSCRGYLLKKDYDKRTTLGLSSYSEVNLSRNPSCSSIFGGSKNNLKISPDVSFGGLSLENDCSLDELSMQSIGDQSQCGTPKENNEQRILGRGKLVQTYKSKAIEKPTPSSQWIDDSNVPDQFADVCSVSEVKFPEEPHSDDERFSQGESTRAIIDEEFSSDEPTVSTKGRGKLVSLLEKKRPRLKSSSDYISSSECRDSSSSECPTSSNDLSLMASSREELSDSRNGCSSKEKAGFVNEHVEKAAESSTHQPSGVNKKMVQENEYSTVDNPLNESVRVVLASTGIVHGSTEILLAETAGELNLDGTLYSSLIRNNMQFLTRPQRLIMPSVLTRRSVLIVGPNGSMKTSGIIVPLTNLLKDTNYYSPLRPGNGPICVFVAPSSNRVRALRNIIARLCTNSIIMTHGGGLEMERAVELTTGCDILITTPRCWLRLLKFSVVTNLSRVCHVVFDRFDTLSKLFSPELSSISRKLKDMENLRTKKGGSLENLKVQIIVNAEQWSPKIELLATKELSNPIVIITSFVEALLYARIKPQLSIILSHSKYDKLKAIISEYPGKKIVIFCNSSSSVMGIHQEVLSNDRTYIPAHGKMTKSLLQDVQYKWNNAPKPPVLIRTDDTMDDFCISNADVLIHYALPESKSSFSERFAVLLDHIPDRIINPQVKPPNCHVNILLDESFEKPLPFLIEFLYRVSDRIPAKVMETVKSLLRREEEKKTTSVCRRLLSSGCCLEESTCQARHILLTEDKSTGIIQRQMLIKVHVLVVHSPVCYSVRLLAYNPDPSGKGPWTKYKNSFSALNCKISSFYACIGNHRLHGKINLGDIAAYRSDSNSPFQRALVLDIIARNKMNEPSRIKVRLIDFADEIAVESHQMYALPEELQQVPPQALIIYVANLKPIDFDTAWSSAATFAIQKQIAHQEKEDFRKSEVIGKVLFTLQDNIIVNNLTWHQNMYNCSVVVLDIKHKIISMGFGLENPKYSETIMKLFREAFQEEFEESNEFEKRELKEGKKIPITPSWAHLNKEEITQVEIMQTTCPQNSYSPDEFFVRIKKFNESLMRLEKEMSLVLNQEKKVLHRPEIGDICAVEIYSEEDDKTVWKRGLIESFEDNAENAYVRLVDQGEIISETALYFLPSKFISLLPFQAIRCSISHLFDNYRLFEDKDEGWWYFRTLTSLPCKFFVKIVNDELTTEGITGNKYKVALICLEGNGAYFIHDELVRRYQIAAKNLDCDMLTYVEGIPDESSNVDLAELESDTNPENDDWDTPAPPVSPSNLAQESASTALQLDFNFDNVDDDEWKSFMSSFTDKDGSSVERPQSSGEQFGKRAIEPLREEETFPCSPCDSTIDSKVSDACQEDPETLSLTKVNLETPAVEDLDDIPALEPYRQSKNPEVIWSQDPTTVVLRFMIPCITSYSIHCSSCSLLVSGIVDGMEGKQVYRKQIFFFGPVLFVTDKLDGLRLTVKLRKVVSGYLWPRLIHSPRRDRRIRIETPPESEENLSFMESFTRRAERRREERGGTALEKAEVTRRELTVDLSDDEDEPEFERLPSGSANFDPFEL